MQVVPRLRNLFNPRSSLAISTTRLDSFHSTSVCNEIWKKKRNSGFKDGQQPSKNYIRYITRKKRADAKRALRNLVYDNDAYVGGFQNKEMLRKINGITSSDDEEWDDNPDSGSPKKRKSKLQSRRAQKAKSKMKRNRRKDYICDDEDDPAETMFRAAFGSKWYTWSFNPHNGFSFHSSSSGFEWRDNTNSKQEYYRHSRTESESDDGAAHSSTGGSHSDRTLLGLPPYGPINLADVKNAFRLSALKWHPDKHQGASQAEAEKRFKLCVNAYNSLRSSVSTA